LRINSFLALHQLHVPTISRRSNAKCVGITRL